MAAVCSQTVLAAASSAPSTSLSSTSSCAWDPKTNTLSAYGGATCTPQCNLPYTPTSGTCGTASGWDHAPACTGWGGGGYKI